MLASPKLKLLEDLLGQTNKEELAWISGYISGILSNGGDVQQAAAPAKPAIGKMTINPPIRVILTNERKRFMIGAFLLADDGLTE